MASNHHNQLSKQAIIKTVAYSDIFDFPLTKEEMWQFLISKQKIRIDDFEKALNYVTNKYIAHKDGYYSFIGREEIIIKRQKNKEENQKKLKIAKNAARILSYIPTILFIGLSGSVALGNADESDDIDFFIITEKNTIWITRVWILALLETMNLRRKPKEKNPKNKICTNLIIEETAREWPKQRRDLYTAHEIVQVRTLFERKNIYRKFISSNQWVEKFFPNILEQQNHTASPRQYEYKTLKAISISLKITQMEKIARLIQKAHMKKQQTKEIIRDNFLAFHPYDYRTKTLTNLNKKLKQYGLLTNS